ncbi:MAG: hypothetical protein WBV82_11030 [Myxococcaceae bacterium]
MNIKILGAFLTALVMSGCVVSNAPPAAPGDVTFGWSFGGGTCFDVPDVKTVVVNIAGQTLENDGAYPCSANNFPGIVLHDFAPRTYSFTIDAYDYGDKRIFVGSGTFTVNGNVRVDIDLQAVGGSTSSAYLTWRFPPNGGSQNPSCSQAGVTYVDVSIDGAPWERFNCVDGFSMPGITTPDLNAGTHDISIVAVSADNYPYYRFDGNLQTFAGRSVAAEYHLNWAVGGAAISWQLSDGSVGLTCAQAGVSTVYVNFEDAQGNLVYGEEWDAQPCNGTPVLYSYLLPGTYRVYVDAVGSGSSRYESNMNNPPLVTIQAGVFPNESNPLVLNLTRI